MATGNQFTLCAIYRDEARNLPAFIERHGTLFDEYIFVDTGSRDNSAEILRAAGFPSLRIAWQNDFSAARNFSLQHASMPYIIILDIDEYLRAEDFAQLQSLMAANPADAYWLNQINLSDDYQQVGWQGNHTLPEPIRPYASGYIVSSLLRVLRNGRGISFRGTIHEMAADSIQEKHLHSAVTAIPIYHLGWTNLSRNSAEKMQKKAQYRAMIKAGWEREKSPKSALYYIMTLDDRDPEKIRVALQMTRLCPHVCEFWEILVFACRQNQQWLRVESYCRKALALHSNSQPLHAALSSALRELGKPDEALTLSAELCRRDPFHPLYTLEHFKNLVVLGRSAAAADVLQQLPAHFPAEIGAIMHKLFALIGA